jgi:hypothetical protein
MLSALKRLDYLLIVWREAVAILLFLVLYLAPARMRFAGDITRWCERNPRPLAMLVWGTVLGEFAFYIAFPRLLDFGSATVLSISWLVAHGGSAYPDWSAGGAPYTLPYGPWLFWIFGAAERVWANMIWLKIVGGVFFLAGLALAWRRFVRAGKGVPVILPMLYLGLMIVPIGAQMYWTRGEPILFFCAVASLAVAEEGEGIPAAIALGLLAGLASGQKLHGALYVLPAIAFFVAGGKAWPRRFVLLAGVGVAALLPSLLPALIDPAVLTNYPRHLALMTREGLSIASLLQNLSFEVLAALPLLLIRKAPDWRHPTRQDWFDLALLVSALLFALSASKPGSGLLHLVPLLPAIILSTLAAAKAAGANDGDAIARRARSLFATAIAALALATLPDFRTAAVGMIKLARAWPEAIRADRELEHWLTLYPQAELGEGDTDHMEDAYARPLQVWKNGRLDIDFTPWMDFRTIGVPESVAARFLDGCRVPVWILPGGAPFSIANNFTGAPLFSPAFRARFRQGYDKVARGDIYSVWQCTKSAP